ALTRLAADEVGRMIDDGAAVVDVRTGRDYDRGHIPGSYFVGIEGPVSAWVGWLIARGRPIVLVGGTDSELRKAQRQLLRIGVDIRDRRRGGHGAVGPERRADDGRRCARRARVGGRPRAWRRAHVCARRAASGGRDTSRGAGRGALRVGLPRGDRGEPPRASR